jgi:hypothetical protein
MTAKILPTGEWIRVSEKAKEAGPSPIDLVTFWNKFGPLVQWANANEGAINTLVAQLKSLINSVPDN